MTKERFLKKREDIAKRDYMFPGNGFWSVKYRKVIGFLWSGWQLHTVNGAQDFAGKYLVLHTTFSVNNENID